MSAEQHDTENPPASPNQRTNAADGQDHKMSKTEKGRTKTAVLIFASIAVVIVVVVLSVSSSSSSSGSSTSSTEGACPDVPDGYDFLEGKASTGYDIENRYPETVAELARACDAESSCVGFNTGGWLKYKIGDLYDLEPSSDCYGQYVKKDTLSSPVPDVISPIAAPAFEPSPSTGVVSPPTISSPFETKISASDGEEGADFGISASISGNTIVIGARDDDGGGSAYVYEWIGLAWIERTKLTASDKASGDWFGQSVAIFEDTIVVGAPYDGNSRGSAYVFVRFGTEWSEEAKLQARDGKGDNDFGVGDNFGRSVAIWANTIVVGAYRDDTSCRVNAGSAYVFDRIGSEWTEQAKLIASDCPGGYFGISVAIWGNTLVVGANDSSGSGYIFVSIDSATWIEQGKLEGGDGFGSSVAIAEKTIVIGSHRSDENGLENGTAYVYVLSGSGWTQQAKLSASNSAAGDGFGSSVAVSGDTVVVGRKRAANSGAIWNSATETDGSAFVFMRSGSEWFERDEIRGSDSVTGDLFSVSVAVNGNQAVIGAVFDDDNGENSGSAYVYNLAVL